MDNFFMYDSIFFVLFNGVCVNDIPDFQETYHIHHYNNQTILGSDGRVFLSHSQFSSFLFILNTTLSSSGLV